RQEDQVVREDVVRRDVQAPVVTDDVHLAPGPQDRDGPLLVRGEDERRGVGARARDDLHHPGLTALDVRDRRADVAVGIVDGTRASGAVVLVDPPDTPRVDARPGAKVARALGALAVLGTPRADVTIAAERLVVGARRRGIRGA